MINSEVRIANLTSLVYDLLKDLQQSYDSEHAGKHDMFPSEQLDLVQTTRHMLATYGDETINTIYDLPAKLASCEGCKGNVQACGNL
jgi:hypothetical protein